MALERLREKITKENLWIYILSMLKKGPMYGYEIATKLRNEKHIDTAIITTYVVLYRMEREQLVQRDRTEGKSAALRKVYYSITESGVAALEKALNLLEGTVKSLRET